MTLPFFFWPNMKKKTKKQKNQKEEKKNKIQIIINVITIKSGN